MDFELLSVGDILMLSQQAWKISRAFAKANKSVPAEFAEVIGELNGLSDALKMAAETLHNDDSFLARAQPETRTAGNAILRSAARTLNNLESLVEHYKVIRKRETSGGSVIETSWSEDILANYKTFKWTTEGGNLTDLRNMLHMHTNTIKVTMQALQSRSLVLLERAVVPIAENINSIHERVSGDLGDKIDDLHRIIMSITNSTPPLIARDRAIDGNLRPVKGEFSALEHGDGSEVSRLQNALSVRSSSFVPNSNVHARSSKSQSGAEDFMVGTESTRLTASGSPPRTSDSMLSPSFLTGEKAPTLTRKRQQQQEESAENSSDVTPNPHVHALQSLKGIEVQPDFENLDALLDPESYFRSLDNLEMDMIERCQLKEMFVQDKQQSDNIVFVTKYTNDPYEKASAKRLSIAIDLLQENGSCQEHIIVLIEDKSRAGVLKAIQLKISDMKDTISYVTNYSITFDRFEKARTTLLDSLGLNTGNYRPRSSVLHALLLVGLISYSGSHCSPLESSLWHNHVNTVTFEDMDLLGISKHEPPWVFRRHRLTCLDSFIGSPVWVFGTSRSPKPASLSISVKQFTELWGPTFAIPQNGDFDTLIALKVDGGVIHCINAIKSECGEILMHFVPTKPMRGEILEDGNCSDRLLYFSATGETLPGHLTAFPSTAQLIIGHPTHSTTMTAETLVEQPSSRQIDVRESEPLLLKINENCKLDVQRFRQDNAHRLQPLGTRADFYAPDEFQAGFSAGQYVSVGVQKVWRRRPGITYKNMLLEYCSKPQAKLLPILSLQVGLQFSICTGNARRISLWDALILSHPEQADELEAMRHAGNSTSLSSYIYQLAQTGVNERGHLELFWPFKQGIPDVFELDASAATWTKLLKETRSSTCFALMSSRCLTYRGRDTLAEAHDSRITQACHGLACWYAKGLLQTVINLNPGSRATLPLQPRARLKVLDGFLEMRNTALATYHENSPFNRIRELCICAIDSHRGHIHEELLDPGRASNYVLSICIMNNS